MNFGHTFGHAIESYFLNKKKPIFHGEAILMGIILESEISKISIEEKNEISKFINSAYCLPKTPSLNKLKKFLVYDKKNKKNKLNFSLLNGIGNCTYDNFFEINYL